MKIVTTVEYTKEDEVMLRKPLPPNPCDVCAISGCAECCGCPDAREYAKLVQPYRDAGIYDLARKIEKMRKLEKQARAIVSEYQKMNDELPYFARLENISVTRVM